MLNVSLGIKNCGFSKLWVLQIYGFIFYSKLWVLKDYGFSISCGGTEHLKFVCTKICGYSKSMGTCTQNEIL